MGVSPTVTRKTIQGVELGYAEITSNFTQTGIGNSLATGLEITVVVRDRPIIVELQTGSLGNTSASGITQAIIEDGSGTDLAIATVSLTTIAQNVSRRVRLNPGPGSQTYQVRLVQAVTGNSFIGATATSPSYIAAYEV